MNEELVKQRINYKVQLQQVEEALSQNPENEDLLKLKKDLQQAVVLTKQILSSQDQPSSSQTGISDDNLGSNQLCPSWKVGDDCLAVWSKDGHRYKAMIKEIDEENDTAVISFVGYSSVEVKCLLDLKPIEKIDSETKAKKEKLALQQEYKKKKAIKKAQQAKEMDQQREAQKNKWQKFYTKINSKNKKGHTRKSIFASPETIDGKVGIGTCGIADKPMTPFTDNSKYNVRHLMPQ